MTHTNDTTYRFPELDLVDVMHLHRLHNLHGRDRVKAWLKSKVGIPLTYQFEDDFDEEQYYEAMTDHYTPDE